MQGDFNFLVDSVAPSLWRNGAVKMIRDSRGNTAETIGADMQRCTLPVIDARSLHGDQRRTCEQHGFELLDHAPPKNMDFLDHDNVVRHYYRDCEALVAAHTGATALAFDHNVRSASGQNDGKQVRGGQDVQGPAHVVHGDYTLRSAPDRLEQLGKPPQGNDTLCGYLPEGEALIKAEQMQAAMEGRFAIINVWRNILDTPVQTHPIGLCDARTVRSEELVVFEIHYADRIGENYFSRYSPEHRMYCYPELRKSEALLIKQWDSAGALARSSGAENDGTDSVAPCTFSFHSAFLPQPGNPGAADRWSIEVRCLVLYE